MATRAPAIDPAAAGREATGMANPGEAARALAAVLLAAGTPPAALRDRANAGLEALGQAPLADDLVAATPEEIAPHVRAALRQPLGALLIEIAGDEPLRLRLAASFLRLWGFGPPLSPDSPDRAGPVVRWLVGALPQHQRGHRTHEESPMHETRESAYRAPQGPTPGDRAPEPIRARAERVRGEFLAVIEAVERVIIGKREVIERALVAMAARGHVLFVDAPGVGKTQLCKAICAATGLRFGRVQFTPDLLPMDVTGGSIYDAQARAFVMRKGPIFTEFLLADEINRATPKTQSALLEVMEERTVTVDGTTHTLPDPFVVLATMNPLEHDGTFPLPAAQIDRFMMMLEMGCPSFDDEVRVLDTHLHPDPAHTRVDPVLSTETFCAWQALAPQIHVSTEVKRTAVLLVEGLRRDAPTAQVSPRATLAWVRAAQARAMVSGREFVTSSDLFEIAPDVLRHRVQAPRAEVDRWLKAVAATGRVS